MDKSRQPGAFDGVSERELARSETINKFVSRETIDEKIAIYVQLLLKWQQKINLISGNTIDDIWQRHIKDSLQLQKFIPADTKTIIDLGSGAGLPAIPLCVATGVKTYLIESDRRKSIFLDEVIRHIGIDAVTINKRIEKAEVKNIQTPLIITARALADLNKIFALINQFFKNNHLANDGDAMYKIILLKGENVSRETIDAEKDWKFKAEFVPSESNKAGSVVIIDKLEPR